MFKASTSEDVALAFGSKHVVETQAEAAWVRATVACQTEEWLDPQGAGQAHRDLDADDPAVLGEAGVAPDRPSAARPRGFNGNIC
jgi:hypothetical protein